MEETKEKTSKSKTFPVKSDFWDLYSFFGDHIETEYREIITNTPQGYDIVTATKHKYIITITKIES